MQYLQYLLAHGSDILFYAGIIHTVALAIVNLTPTPVDNDVVGKIYKAVEWSAGVITAVAKEHPGEREAIAAIKAKATASIEQRVGEEEALNGLTTDQVLELLKDIPIGKDNPANG